MTSSLVRRPETFCWVFLVPGEGRPGLAPVAGVAVGDRDPGEGRQDSALLHGLDAAVAQVERGIQLGERAVDVLLLSRGAGTERGLVEPGDRRGRDQEPRRSTGTCWKTVR